MSVTLNITNASLERFNKNIRKYSKSTRKKVAKAVIGSAYNIEKNAKISCPVRTGRLRSSLHVEAKKINSFKGGQASESGDGKFNTKYKGVLVGTNVKYAKDVEYGKVKTKTGHQPFLRPAARKEKPILKRKIKKILRER